MIEIDGPEVPVMDGSAEAFIDAIDQAGVDGPGGAAPLHPGSEAGARRARAIVRRVPPHDGTRIEVEIDFANPLIGRQSFAAEINAEVFRDDIARARTFGFLADVEELWARGFALGASLDNAVVIGDDRVVNPEGLRYADEFVRHKVLDAVGDLALAGAPILGAYRSYRGGHRLNVMAARRRCSPTGRRGGSSRRRSGAKAAMPSSRPASALPAFGPDVS